MKELDSKVGIVTGAGQGVGQGIAFALASMGAKVVVCGRTLAKVENTLASIRERGGDGLALQCDVNDRPSLEALVRRTVDDFGGINILVTRCDRRCFHSRFYVGPASNKTFNGFVLPASKRRRQHY